MGTGKKGVQIPFAREPPPLPGAIVFRIGLTRVAYVEDGSSVATDTSWPKPCRGCRVPLKLSFSFTFRASLSAPWSSPSLLILVLTLVSLPVERGIRDIHRASHT